MKGGALFDAIIERLAEHMPEMHIPSVVPLNKFGERISEACGPFTDIRRLKRFGLTENDLIEQLHDKGSEGLDEFIQEKIGDNYSKSGRYCLSHDIMYSDILDRIKNKKERGEAIHIADKILSDRLSKVLKDKDAMKGDKIVARIGKSAIDAKVKFGLGNKIYTKEQAKEMKKKLNIKAPLNQVYMGLNVEAEHHKDLEETAQIVKDHILEDKEYYTKLKKLGLGIQAILFSKNKWQNEDERNKWLDEHKMKPIKEVHETDKYYRYRLEEVDENKKYRQKPLSIKKGIYSIIQI